MNELWAAIIGAGIALIASVLIPFATSEWTRRSKARRASRKARQAAIDAVVKAAHRLAMDDANWTPEDLPSPDPNRHKNEYKDAVTDLAAHCRLADREVLEKLAPRYVSFIDDPSQPNSPVVFALRLAEWNRRRLRERRLAPFADGITADPRPMPGLLHIASERIRRGLRQAEEHAKPQE